MSQFFLSASFHCRDIQLLCVWISSYFDNRMSCYQEASSSQPQFRSVDFHLSKFEHEADKLLRAEIQVSERV